MGYIDRIDRRREYHNQYVAESRTNRPSHVEGVQVDERDDRLHIKFDFDSEALHLIQSLPGSRWSWGDHSWSVSTRYRKRVAEAVSEIEALLVDREAQLKALDEAAVTDPLPAVAGFTVTSVRGRWVIVSRYDPVVVAAFKRIHGAKWNGSAWTFPAAARAELTDFLNQRGGEQS